MVLQSTWMDPVVGLDLHMVVMPPNIPTLVPMPFVGMVSDGKGMAVGAGMSLATTGGAPPVVLVNGLPATNCGTAVSSKETCPHLPAPGVSFLPPPSPPNDAQLYFGSLNVSIGGAFGVRLGDKALSCSDPVRLPTSTVLALPKGPPVLNMPAMALDVGTAATALMQAGAKYAGAAVWRRLQPHVRRGATLFREARAKSPFFQKVSRKLGGCTPPANASRWRQMWQRSVRYVTGHPVDVVTGNLFTEAVDLELDGPLPLRLERVYESAGSRTAGALGYGWSHTLDERLWIERLSVVVRCGDGREVEFPTHALPERRMRPGDVIERLIHKQRLRNVDGRRFELTQPDGRVHVFEPVPGGAKNVAPLRQIRSADRCHVIDLLYDDRGRLTWVRDSGGRTLRFEHDERGRLTGLYAPLPRGEGHYRHRAYRYDEHDNLVEVRDALGGTYRYAYRGHLLVQETNRVGLSFYFQYDEAGQEAKCVRTWGDGGIYDHVIHYDANNRKTVVENSLNQVTLYEYDHRNQVVAITDACGRTTRYAYDEATAQVVEEQQPDGGKSAFVYDARGNLVESVGPDGATMAVQYDERGLPVAAVDAVGGTWTWRRDERGRVVERTDPLRRSTRFHYDRGLLVQVVDPSGGRTALSYDAQRLLASLTYPDGTSTSLKRDQLGNVLEVVDPKGNIQRREYDALGRAIRIDEPDGNVRALTYDAEGSVVRARDHHHDVRFAYCGMGRLAERHEAGTTVRFEYDTEERLTGVVNEHGRVYRFVLDAVGDVEEEHGFDGLLRQYQRDAAGRVAGLLRPGDRLTKYQYDAAGRVTGVEHWDGARETYLYRADGALMQATNDSVRVAFERDLLGRVTRETQGEHWVESHYGALGLRTRVTSSLGARHSIERNAMGDVTQVAEERSGFFATFARDEVGLELARTLPGGIYARTRRDRVGRPIEHQVESGTNTLRAASYHWEPNDRLRRVVDATHGPTEYRHDALGNLAASLDAQGTLELRLPDAVGNLFRTADRSDRRYGPAGQLLERTTPQGTVTYAYDPEGNLIEKREPNDRVWRYRWNASGMLEKVTRPDGTEVMFAYDALGRRIRKTYRGQVTRWVWDGNVPLHEWVEGTLEAVEQASAAAGAATDVAQKRREAELEAHLAQGPPARGSYVQPITWLFEPESFAPLARLCGDEVQSIVCDYLGTPVLTSDNDGRTVWSAGLSTYGELRYVQGSRWACPFRWPGQYEDLETGLYYNRFRYYDAEAGQYVSQDPIGLAGGAAVYAYVHDPLAWLDPLGLTRRPWQLRDENISAKRVVGKRTYSRHSSTGLWWSRDTAGHGGSVFKVFEEKGGKLHWLADADEYGDFIDPEKKHKGPKGKKVCGS